MDKTAIVRSTPSKIQWLFAIVTAYFVLQVALRVVYASALGNDEAEMMILTQALTAGYGAQPPLYGWLQMLVFEIFGRSILGLAGLRFFLLWVTFAFAFLSARRIFEDDGKAWAATMALFTIPQFFWGSQISLTHTVLATAIGSITLYAMLCILRSGAWRHYLALGLCIALGMVSKYNYLLLVFALLLSALTMPSLRGRVLDYRLPVSLALSVLLLLPHLYWLSTHVDVAFAQADKFKFADKVGILGTMLPGVEAVLRSFFSYLGMSVVLFAAIAFIPLRARARLADTRPGATGSADNRHYVLRVLLIAFALVFCAVIASQATRVNERWLHPIFFIAPLGFFILLEPRLSAQRRAILEVVSTGLAISSIVGLIVMHYFPQFGSDPRPALSPFPALVAEIRELGFGGGYILASNSHIAGNLNLRFPDSTVAEPHYGLWPHKRRGQPGNLLLAWQGDEAPPSSLIELWQQLCGTSVSTEIIRNPQQVAAPYERSSVQYTLNVAIVPMCRTVFQE